MASDRKNQILQEATRLFSHFGYDRVTVKQLAEACGISEPALYRHFESKDSIYDAVLDSLVDKLDFHSIFTRLEKTTYLDQIMFGLAEHIMEFFESHKESYRLLLYSTLREHAKARQVYRALRVPYVDFLKAQLDRLYNARLIKAKNNEITARCFIGMVFDCALNASMWKGFYGTTYAGSEVMENNIPIYIDGLKMTPESTSG